jgi:curved DNA-binding protein CbpA
MGRGPADSPDDHYEALGVAIDADAAEVRRAWRRLVLAWHPDRAGDEATARFQQISAAYVVLSDPDARAAYDRTRGVEVPRRRAPGAMLQRLSGPLNSLVACGVARRIDAALIELVVDGEEAAQGGMVTISMRVPVVGAGGETEELFSAWLAVPPGVDDGAILEPSVRLRGMVHPVRFRIRRRG